METVVCGTEPVNTKRNAEHRGEVAFELLVHERLVVIKASNGLPAGELDAR